jgi:hypothetical protein
VAEVSTLVRGDPDPTALQKPPVAVNLSPAEIEGLAMPPVDQFPEPSKCIGAEPKLAIAPTALAPSDLRYHSRPT